MQPSEPDRRLHAAGAPPAGGNPVVDLRFLAREISIYFPYPQDFPVDLLALGGLSSARIEAARSQPLVRVARHAGRTVGAYLLTAQCNAPFSLDALAVLPDLRRRGIGSWLVGHALGVAEAKGARCVACPAHPALDAMLQRLGFMRAGDCWKIEIEPE